MATHTITSKEVLYTLQTVGGLPRHGSLFLGEKVVMLDKLRDQVLQLVHLGHFGIQTMKQLARSVVYWPHINEHIEQVQARTQDFEKGGYEGHTHKTTPTLNDQTHSHVIVTCITSTNITNCREQHIRSIQIK